MNHFVSEGREILFIEPIDVFDGLETEIRCRRPFDGHIYFFKQLDIEPVGGHQLVKFFVQVFET